MATTKLTDRDGAVVGKWATCRGRRVRVWVIGCPEAGCRYQASGLGGQDRVLECMVDHLRWAHREDDDAQR